MKSAITSSLRAFIERYHIPWILVYALLLFGTASLAISVYQEYDEHRLPGGYITLEVGKTRYQPGEIVEFTLVNHFSSAIYVTNECPGEPLNVYRWENGAWIALHATVKNPDSECYQEERNVAIPPEGSRSYSYRDWPTLFAEPGIYRIAAMIDHSNEIPFQDFVVEKPTETIPVPAETSVAPPPARSTDTPQIIVTPTENDHNEVDHSVPIIAPTPLPLEQEHDGRELIRESDDD